MRYDHRTAYMLNNSLSEVRFHFITRINSNGFIYLYNALSTPFESPLVVLECVDRVSSNQSNHESRARTSFYHEARTTADIFTKPRSARTVGPHHESRARTRFITKRGIRRTSSPSTDLDVEPCVFSTSSTGEFISHSIHTHFLISISKIILGLV